MGIPLLAAHAIKLNLIPFNWSLLSYLPQTISSSTLTWFVNTFSFFFLNLAFWVIHKTCRILQRSNTKVEEFARGIVEKEFVPNIIGIPLPFCFNF